jgi:hypothetical protein
VGVWNESTSTVEELPFDEEEEEEEWITLQDIVYLHQHEKQ